MYKIKNFSFYNKIFGGVFNNSKTIKWIDIKKIYTSKFREIMNEILRNKLPTLNIVSMGLLNNNTVSIIMLGK